MKYIASIVVFVAILMPADNAAAATNEYYAEILNVLQTELISLQNQLTALSSNTPVATVAGASTLPSTTGFTLTINNEKVLNLASVSTFSEALSICYLAAGDSLAIESDDEVTCMLGDRIILESVNE